MEYDELMELLVSRNERIYYTDERTLEDWANLLHGMGLSNVSIVRLFDILVFPTETVIAVSPKLDNGEIMIEKYLDHGEPTDLFLRVIEQWKK